jgi:hypothetical protein
LGLTVKINHVTKKHDIINGMNFLVTNCH